MMKNLIKKQWHIIIISVIAIIGVIATPAFSVANVISSLIVLTLVGRLGYWYVIERKIK
jgi:hypothetical protein